MGAKAWVRTDSRVLPAAGTLILSQRPVGEVGSKQTLQACVCPGEEPNIEQERWTVIRGLWAGRGGRGPTLQINWRAARAKPSAGLTTDQSSAARG